MTRRAEFHLSEEEYVRLYARQQGLCAITGEPLNESVVGHHVVPASLEGRLKDPEAKAFLEDPERNCVLVNDTPDFGGFRDEGAHIHAHGGDFRDGPVAPHGWVRFSHGEDFAAHREWAEIGDAGARRVWSEIEPTPEPGGRDLDV